jgi:pimeloyl-ACP methyl ester carboxylesterase
VFAHGLGSGIPDTRPFGSGIPGTRIFFQFRGHGRSGRPDGPWTYADLAEDLATAAAGASRAVGVSLGAAVLCRLLTDAPRRFERLVFVMPAALDRPSPPAAATRFAALRRGDASAEVPDPRRDAAYLRQRAAYLTRYPLAPALAGLLADVPVPDPAVLAAVRAPALVIGCEGDELHPAPVARRLAESLGHATLHVYGEPAILWTARRDLRDRISTFLKE